MTWAMVRDLTGRTFLVTGANTGIGRATTVELARRGGKVWMACRTLEKARPLSEAIRRQYGSSIELLRLDLSDLASVRSCAHEFVSRADGRPLDTIINNAGIAWTAGG